LAGPLPLVTALGIAAILTWIIEKYKAKEAVAHPLAFGGYVAWSIVSSLFLTPLALCDGFCRVGTRTKKENEEVALGTPVMNALPSERKGSAQAIEKPISARQSVLHRFVVIVLYLVLAGIIVCAFVIGFYAVNSSATAVANRDWGCHFQDRSVAEIPDQELRSSSEYRFLTERQIQQRFSASSSSSVRGQSDRNNLEKLRSARSLPPVWQRTQ
jgi:hypothetical protein